MKKTIYLDNAATSFPKPGPVIREVQRCISKYCANPGRSAHNMAMLCADKVYRVREEVANFLGSNKPEGIVFTSNATHALNIAIKGLIDHKCHVITSDLEHNSVIRPLKSLVDSLDIEISVFNSDLPLREAISPLIRSDTKFIVTTLASNVTGKTVNVEELSSIAREHGLTCIADASQYLGHWGIDLNKTPLDVVCAPSHKALLGIQGGGFLALSCKQSLKTIMEGGSGADSTNPRMPKYIPERLEAGTLNLPAIVSLGEGLRYIKKVGIDCISEKNEYMTELLLDRLFDLGASVYGMDSGIVSFEIPSLSTDELSYRIAEAGIAIRSGLHCAPWVHEKLGTDKRGLIRVSFSIFNTKRDVEFLYKALKAIKNGTA